MNEQLGHFDQEPTPGNLEFYLVVSALRAKFEKAKQEQQGMSAYRMFTVVDEQGEGEVYARMRIADSTLVSDSLDLVSRSDESAIDVALPIEAVDVDNPELADGERGGQFLLYSRNPERSTPSVISVANLKEFLEENPDFLSKSLQYEPIPIRKTEVA